jgi:hypothetical protein
MKKNGVFWDVTPCDSCLNRRYVELSATFMRVTRNGELGTLAVTSDVPSPPIFVTQMEEALSSSETSVLTRATRRNIPERAMLTISSEECSLLRGGFLSSVSQ